MRRENRDVTRSASPEHRLDPFRMMDALLRWDPFRGDRGGFGQNLEFVPRFDVRVHLLRVYGRSGVRFVTIGRTG